MQLTSWRPRYSGASASLFDVYRKGGQRVALYLGYYAHPRRGAELVTTTNVMVVQKDPVWQKIAQSVRTRKLGKGSAEVRETHLQSPGQKLLIWDWFRIAGHDLSNPYLAKLLLAREKLLGHRTGGAAIIVATPYHDQPGAAEQTLREFVREMLPSIEATLTEVNSR